MEPDLVLNRILSELAEALGLSDYYDRECMYLEIC